MTFLNIQSYRKVTHRIFIHIEDTFTIQKNCFVQTSNKVKSFDSDKAKKQSNLQSQQPFKKQKLALKINLSFSLRQVLLH